MQEPDEDYRLMETNIPDWLDPLLCSKFYDRCNDHPELRSNEKNQFCIDCKLCLCKHCVSTVQSHGGCIHNRLLKSIWMYQYQEVIAVDVIQQHFDCSKIQVHKRHNKEAVHLTRRNKEALIFTCGGKTSCENCGWTFGRSDDHYGYRFCSIECKVSVIKLQIERNQRQEENSEVPNLEAAEGNSSGNASQSLTAQVNEPPPDLSRDLNQQDLNDQPDINEPDLDPNKRKRPRKSSNPVKFTSSNPQQQ